MEAANTLERARSECWTDEEVVARVKAGDTALFELIMRRYNQRLYRVAQAILHDDSEAEDVVQDAYVRAYEHLHQFAGRAAFSTWLTRIAVHGALARLRLRNRKTQIDTVTEAEFPMTTVHTSLDPEQTASASELAQLLEDALLDLPMQYRTVIMLRDIEEMSTSETAAVLDLSDENVKIRLHRARTMMRGWLYSRVGANAKNAFPFMAARCDRVVRAVLDRLSSPERSSSDLQ